MQEWMKKEAEGKILRWTKGAAATRWKHKRRAGLFNSEATDNNR
jgi:hypothetical protein